MPVMQLAELFTETMVRKLGATGWEQVPPDEDGPTFVRYDVPELEYQASMLLTVRPDGILVNPVLGVAHPETSRVRRKFAGQRPSPGASVGLVGATIADLLFADGIQAPYSRWVIATADQVEPVTDRLVTDLETYGEPFFRSMPTLDAAIARLQQEGRAQPQTGNLAIAYAVAGRLPEALAALAEYAAEARGQQPPLSTQSWRFVRSFIDHFGIAESSLPYPIGS
jgi:hypothetical protein